MYKYIVLRTIIGVIRSTFRLVSLLELLFVLLGNEIRRPLLSCLRPSTYINITSDESLVQEDKRAEEEVISSPLCALHSRMFI